MHSLDGQPWRDQIILSRQISTPGERNAFYSAVRRGHFVALHRGAFVAAKVWEGMDHDARYRARILAAVVGSSREIVVSHDSGGALWRLPIVGEWPTKIHVTEPRAAGGTSSQLFHRHTVGLPDREALIQGVRVTELARTVIDIASTRPFAASVAVADAALSRTANPHPDVPRTFLSLDELRAELELLPVNRGSVKARRVIEFANGLADRPGESLSRVTIHQIGLTPPELQVRLQGASGRWYVVDFWWPEFNHIGEFDGQFKYSDAQFLRGRTPQQALLDEKFREDDLRAASHGMSRWGWDVARSTNKLRALLLAAGIR